MSNFVGLGKQEQYSIGGDRMEREQITIRLPAELKERLQQEADKREVSFNGLVIEYLWRCLEDQ